MVKTSVEETFYLSLISQYHKNRRATTLIFTLLLLNNNVMDMLYVDVATVTRENSC